MAENSLFLTEADAFLISNSICCVHCRDLLQPPIMLVSENGYACLHCAIQRNENAVRISALETVLGVLKLPCKFRTNGCRAKLGYEDLRVHQNTQCEFRSKLCSLNECTWEGRAADFVNHFKTAHKNHVINVEGGVFQLQTSFNDLKEVLKLIVMQNSTYFLQVRSVAWKTYYQIYDVKKEKDALHEYSVEHQVNNQYYLKRSSKVLPAPDVFEEDTISYLNKEQAIVVDWSFMKQMAKKTNTVTTIFKFKIGNELADKKILESLECPVCKNAMRPPINMCQVGHSICKICRSELDKCPVCKTTFTTSRNFALEALTLGILYPCIYQSQGCTEVSVEDKISKHENKCRFKTFSCPVSGCRYSGNKLQVGMHMASAHDKLVHVSNSFNIDKKLGNSLLQNNCYQYSYNMNSRTGFNVNSGLGNRSDGQIRYLIICNHIFKISTSNSDSTRDVELIGFDTELNKCAFELIVGSGIESTEEYNIKNYNDKKLPKLKCVQIPHNIVDHFTKKGSAIVKIIIIKCDC